MCGVVFGADNRRCLMEETVSLTWLAWGETRLIEAINGRCSSRCIWEWWWRQWRGSTRTHSSRCCSSRGGSPSSGCLSSDGAAQQIEDVARHAILVSETTREGARCPPEDSPSVLASPSSSSPPNS